MSIGRLFSGSGGRKAAVAENMYNLEQGLEPSLNNVNQAASNARLYLTGGFGNARNAMQQGQTALTQGRDNAQNFMGQAISGYQPFADGTMRGFSAFSDATGANGAEGIGRANSLFRMMEGYQGGLNTGLDQLERRAAARGMLGGGNTSADTIRFASDYDGQQFGRFVQNLSPFLSAAGASQGNLAQMRARQGDIETQFGRDMASSLANMGQLFANESTALAGNDWQEANAANNVRAMYVPRMAGKIGEGMQAGDRAAANQMGAIMGGLQLGSQALGSMFGGGLGSMGSLFGGGGAVAGAGAGMAPMQLGGGSFMAGSGGFW